MNELTAAGLAIVISRRTPELLGMSDASSYA
jgi:hypothetical protein